MKTPLFLLGLVLIGSAQALPWQPLTTLAISADGQSLFSGGVDGEVLQWESSTGEVLHRWMLPTGPVVAISAAKTMWGAVGVDGKVWIPAPDGTIEAADSSSWPALAAARSRWVSQGPSMSGVAAVQGSVEARGFPDGHIALTSGVGSLRSWQAHSAAVTGLVWSSDGAVLYSCSFDGSLAEWDSQSGQLLGRL